MKKYKLIKEYPGSPELGTILIEHNEDYIKHAIKPVIALRLVKQQIENHPEFWQEIEEERYFKCLYPNDWTNTIKDNNGYLIFPGSFKTHITNISIIEFSKKVNLWQEVTKEEYEAQFVDYTILTVRQPKIANDNFPIHQVNSDGTWGIFDNQRYSQEKALALGWTIHSVKRKSDGEIFTVGDKCTSYATAGIITKIWICGNGGLRIESAGNYCMDIKNIQKAKQLLFTTDDDVDVFAGDKYYIITPSFNYVDNTATKTMLITKDALKRFSTKEAAEKYIVMNKPCLSLEEVFNIYTTTHPTCFFKVLENNIKKKLKI